MQYPNEFDTAAFPAGKALALSRAMGIGISVLFFLIICACGILFWATRSARVEPFLISIDDVTGAWEIVGHEHSREYSAIRTVQESVAANFVKNWFTISESDEFNNDIWAQCDRKTCNSDEYSPQLDTKCALYCACKSTVFNDFNRNVLPYYRERVAAQERWIFDTASLDIRPLSDVTNDAGTWQVTGNIISNINGNIPVIAFVKIARNEGGYRQNLGYYVTDFNAYRISK